MVVRGARLQNVALAGRRASLPQTVKQLKNLPPRLPSGIREIRWQAWLARV